MDWAKHEGEKHWLNRVPAIRLMKVKDLPAPEFIPLQTGSELHLMRIQGAVVVPAVGECQVDLRIAAITLKNNC